MSRLPFEVEIVYEPKSQFPWRAYQLPRTPHDMDIEMAMTSWGLRLALRKMARRYAKAERMTRKASTLLREGGAR